MRDLFGAIEYLSNKSGALTAYVTKNNEVDDAYWDTLDQIKDGEFDTPEEAVTAILEIFNA